MVQGDVFWLHLIDIPMNEQTSQSSKSIFCHCRSAPVFQASHSRKRPLTGHGPYRHCEQNPKNSMQIRIIVRVCKCNCFFQRLIRILLLKPCTEHFPSFHFRDKSHRIWQIIFTSGVYISSTCSVDMSWTRRDQVAIETLRRTDVFVQETSRLAHLNSDRRKERKHLSYNNYR